MAVLGEVPFRRYYGSIDSTPLFVHAGRRLFRAHRRPRDHPLDLAEYRGGAALDRNRRRPRRRRLCRIWPRRPRRVWSTRAGKTATIPSSTPTARLRGARSRWPRCRPMSTAPARRGRDGAARSTWQTAPTWLDKAEDLRRRFDEEFLGRGPRHLCAGARRRKKALPRSRLQCRPCAVHRHRALARARRRSSAP